MNRPLCVDLEGGLIATSLFWELLLHALRTKPWQVFSFPGWMIGGQDKLERRLAERSPLDVRTIPYHANVVAYLRERQAEGRRIILVSSVEEPRARVINGHLGLFDEVLAGDGKTKLTVLMKHQAIVDRFGRRGFDYLGGSIKDLPIWESAADVLVVHPGTQLRRSLESRQSDLHTFERAEEKFTAWFRLLRPHQWAKNLLLFVPLIASHRLGDWWLLLTCSIAFVAFCLGASAVYILNDLHDLPSDRLHATKRWRPLATGVISIPAGLTTFALLVATSFSLTPLLPLAFAGMLTLYLSICLAYTFVLKQKVMIDVIFLAYLYSHRILTGGIATGVPISFWLMTFSWFLFLSVAFVKRYTEIAAMGATEGGYLPGRGYWAVDLDLIRVIGPASGYIAVLVICLYLNEPSTAALYRHSQRLWLLCPVTLYWISRVWILAQRGQMDFDPVVFALRDRKSLIAGFVAAATIVSAML